jgi:hypothetical protein
MENSVVANLDQALLTWGGSPVGGGVSVFYAHPGGSVEPALRTFFESIKTWLPSSVGITYPPSGNTIDSATGNLVGTWGPTSLAATVGTDNGNFPVAAGASVTWLTNTVHPAHGGKPSYKISGRTFIVPLGPTAYTTIGTLNATALAALQSAAAALVSGTAGQMAIWSRPTAPGAADGIAADVTGSRVRAKVAVLTSRRD